MKTFLFLLLLVAGGYIFYQHNQIKDLNRTIANLQSIYGSPTQTGPTVSQNETVTEATWQALPITAITTALGPDGSDAVVHFSDAVDLTGDGVPEGIFETGQGATGNTVTIFKFDSAQKPIALKTKAADGSIATASLSEATSATYSVGYKILPDDHGYYETETKNTSTTATPKLSCSLDAYSWNALTGQFEWSQTLTSQYTAQVCKQ